MSNSPLNYPDPSILDMNLLRAIKRHWIVVLISAGLVFGAMAFKTLKQPGIYRSEALIVVASRSSVPLVQDPANQQVLETLPTEIAILQSQTLLNRAVAKLPAAYRTIPLWQIEQNLKLTQPEDTTVLAISYQDTDAVRAKTILDALVETYIEYSEETQRSPFTNAIQFIEQRLPSLQKKVQQSSDALTAFRTKYNLDNPDDSVRFAYTDKEQLQQAIATSEIELRQLKNTYATLQQQMVELGNDPDSSLLDATISQDDTYRYILQQLRELEIQYELELKRYTDKHPIIQELKERRDELRELLEKEKQKNPQLINRKGSQRIELGAIEQQLATQIAQTRVNILAQEQKLQGLRQQSTKVNQTLKNFLELQQLYQELTRRYALDTQTLDKFLAQLQELRIQESQDTFIWKVIEPPNLPAVPQARSRVRGLVLGLIAGGLAGLGMAVFLEKIDTRLRDTQDLKQITDLPILGVIPQAQNATSLLASEQGRNSDSFTEAIRSLTLALSFQNISLNGKVIAITSAITKEGKTTITYNLGLALSELGKRVLIVDANLAYPSLHNIFSLNNSQGLTTAIVFERPWQELIQSVNQTTTDEYTTEVRQTTQDSNLIAVSDENGSLSNAVFAKVSPTNLLIEKEISSEEVTYRLPDVLTTGPVSNASFSWLVSPKMEQLLKEWRRVYDHILIDTSDMLNLADTQSLIPKMDQVIFIASLNHVKKEEILEMFNLFKSDRDRIAGIVVNTTGQGKGKTNEAYTPFN